MTTPKFLVPATVAIAMFGAISFATAQSQIPPAKDSPPSGSSQNQNQRAPHQSEGPGKGTMGKGSATTERSTGSAQPMNDPAPKASRSAAAGDTAGTTRERPARADRN